MNELDIVAVGLDLEPETLIQAYTQGVFPWPMEGHPLLWFCPRERAILEFKDLHVNKRLKQYLKKSTWTYTKNQAFQQVIHHCARRDHEGTWITPEMIEAYVRLHQLGYAHSYEVWENQELVGGVYGVQVGQLFSAESMFHHSTNASKAALIYLIQELSKHGFTWIDIQVMSPHLQALGASTLTRDAFLSRLKITS